MNLLLGTRNEGKIRELLEILADLEDVNLLTFRECPFGSVQESGRTFLENALLKARTIAVETGMAVLAEDAGLEVAALEGQPGVISARFAGSGSNAGKNNALLLKRLKGVTDRRARFVAVVVVRFPHGPEIVGQGVLEGTIAERPYGTGGFGYDPLFIPMGYSKTLAGMTLADKSRISHRRRAIEEIKQPLRLLVSRA